MGNCKYCGTSAGLLRKFHSGCRQRHDAGRELMIWSATEAARSGDGLETLETRLTKTAELSYVPISHMKEVLAQGWEKALTSLLEDNILSEEEERRLTTFAEKFGLSQDHLNADGAYTRAAMAGVLRDVLHGKVPSRVKVEGELPFNLQKSESLVWFFNDVP